MRQALIMVALMIGSTINTIGDSELNLSSIRSSTLLQTYAFQENITTPVTLNKLQGSCDVGPLPIGGAIYSIEELQRIGKDPMYPLDGTYYLAGNIDASATKTWDNGAGFEPIGLNAPTLEFVFSGTLDGKGYSISGLHIKRPETDEIGLFSRITGILKNVWIEGATITGRNYVGILSAMSTKATVINCHASGTVVGQGFTGGLIGKMEQAVTAYSSADCTVTGTSLVGGLVGWHVNFFDVTRGSHTYRCWATGNVTAENLAGGLIGYHTKSSLLEDCFATGSVTATRNEDVVSVGGLVGLSNYSSSSKRCFSVGMVTATSPHPYPEIGPAFGWVRDDVDPGLGAAHAESIYFSFENTTVPDNGIGNGKTTAEMHQEATFGDWDFVKVWRIDEGNDYPRIRLK